MYYVYAYIDPRTDLPFYIGKGSGNRYLYHLSETKDNTENKKKYAYIKGLQNKGFEPKIVKLHENLIETEAYDLETKLIKKYGRKGIDKNGILTNICIDNRPPRIPMSKEARERASKLMMGNTYAKGKPSPFKGKKRPELSGKNNHFYGKTHSKETKQIMSISKQGCIWIYKGDKTKLVRKNETTDYQKHKWLIGRKPTRKGNSSSTEFRGANWKKKIQLNNPNRKDIHTPEGIFLSSEEYANETNKITANGLRNLLKVSDKPITKRRAERCPLLIIENIGKTPRKLGYYYL